VLFSYGPNKAFLVADSCRTTDRNGNIISEDFTKDTIGNYLHTLRNKQEKLVKDLFFLHVSKAHTNKFDIFRQCMHIVYPVTCLEPR